MNCIVEKVGDVYDSELLLDIWEDSLTDLDVRRIKWSYEDNPYGKARLWFLLDQTTNHYCGACAVLPRIFSLDDKEVNVGITADFAIKKQYRCLGPALKLQRSIINSDDFDVLIGMPNENSVGVQLRAGFKTLGSLSRYVKVFRLNKFLKEQIRHSLPPSLNMPAAVFFNTMTMLSKLRLNGSSDDQPCICTQFSDRFNTLWSITKTEFSFAGKREYQYLQWRFGENPYLSYKVFELLEKNSEDLNGYVVFCVRHNIAFIDDISARDFSATFKELVKAFTKYCLYQGYDAVSLMLLADDRYLNVLRKLGFLKFNTNQKILIYNRSSKPIKNDKLFLTYGDFDF